MPFIIKNKILTSNCVKDFCPSHFEVEIEMYPGVITNYETHCGD